MRAAEFLLDDGHGFLPAVIGGGDVDGAEFEVVEERRCRRRSRRRPAESFDLWKAARSGG